MIANGKKYENSQKKRVSSQNSKIDVQNTLFRKRGKSVFSMLFGKKIVLTKTIYLYFLHIADVPDCHINPLFGSSFFLPSHHPVRAADSGVSLYNWFLLSALCHVMPSHIKKVEL